MKSVLLRIMSSALKSIESLEHFYLTEYETIAEKSEKGRRKYCLGWVIDVFFSVLTYANDSEKRTKEYKELEQKVKKEITFKLLPGAANLLCEKSKFPPCILRTHIL